MLLMRQLTWYAIRFNFAIFAEHLPGTRNNIADSLSRLQMDRFRALAPLAQIQPYQCPHPTAVMWSGLPM